MKVLTPNAFLCYFKVFTHTHTHTGVKRVTVGDSQSLIWCLRKYPLCYMISRSYEWPNLFCILNIFGVILKLWIESKYHTHTQANSWQTRFRGKFIDYVSDGELMTHKGAMMFLVMRQHLATIILKSTPCYHTVFRGCKGWGRASSEAASRTEASCNWDQTQGGCFGCQEKEKTAWR